MNVIFSTHLSKTVMRRLELLFKAKDCSENMRIWHIGRRDDQGSYYSNMLVSALAAKAAARG